MDKHTKNELIVGAMGVALGFATVRMIEMGVHIVKLEKYNDFLKQRVDITTDFIRKVNDADEDEAQALAEKYIVDMKFIDQMHGY